MKGRGLIFISIMMVLFSLLLAACNAQQTAEKGDQKEEMELEIAKDKAGNTLPTKTLNRAEAVEDGHLNVGLVTDSPFEGLLNWVFYQNPYDAEILGFFDEALLSTDENYMFNQEGAATYELSADKKIITLTIRDQVKWQDGAPVTGEDLEFAYLVIGHPDYKGVRYDALFQMIEGMDEYHAGRTDRISGIHLAGKKISITFKEATPSILTGLWTHPLHKKYLSDIPLNKIETSDKIRKHPIGFGPFKVKKIVQGQAVALEANNNYWKGKPKLAGITLSVVNSTTAVKSLETGKIDVAELEADLYDGAKALNNIQLLGKIDLAYTYIGFKLGHYDPVKKENVMDKTKLSDKHVRQAIGFAINNDLVGKMLYKGLRFRANTVIPPSFPKYYNTGIKGYMYDPEKAKSLLDEAGYVDKNGDGLREDPNGKGFVLNFAAMAGSDAAEPLIQYYIQQWREIGLNVRLLEGKLQEFNSFYERLENDDKNIDMYQAAWGTGSDPDPSGLWSRDAVFNYTRWVNDQNDALLKKGISQDAFDETYRVNIYKQWQALVDEEAPVIPTLFRYTLLGTNNRVKDLDFGKAIDWSEVSVTAKEAVK